MRPELSPPHLLTGTNLEYTQLVIARFRSYRHLNGNFVYLTTLAQAAFDAAIYKSSLFKATPVILLVNPRYPNLNPSPVDEPRGVRMDYLCEEVPLGAIVGVYRVQPKDFREIVFMKDPTKDFEMGFEKADISLMPSDNRGDLVDQII